MRMAREDVLHIRQIAASHGRELTPDEVINLIRLIRPNIEIDNDPGLITLLRQSRHNDGDIGPSGSSGSSQGS